MLEKRRSGRVSTKTSIEDEIAHLRGLDLKGLRSRWQSVFQKPPPDHLPRHLLDEPSISRREPNTLCHRWMHGGAVMERP
jgi:hypothetical protein